MFFPLTSAVSALLAISASGVEAAPSKAVPKVQCKTTVTGNLILQAYGTFDRPTPGLSSTSARTKDSHGVQARYLVSDTDTKSEKWAFQACKSTYMGWNSTDGLQYGQFRKLNKDGSVSKHCLSAQNVNPKKAPAGGQLVTFSNDCEDDDASQRLVTWQLYYNDYTGTYNGNLQSTTQSSGAYDNYYIKRTLDSTTNTTDLRLYYDPDQDRRREDSNPYWLAFIKSDAVVTPV